MSCVSPTTGNHPSITVVTSSELTLLYPQLFHGRLTITRHELDNKSWLLSLFITTFLHREVDLAAKKTWFWIKVISSLLFGVLLLAKKRMSIPIQFRERDVRNALFQTYRCRSVCMLPLKVYSKFNTAQTSCCCKLGPCNYTAQFLFHFDCHKAHFRIKYRSY